VPCDVRITKALSAVKKAILNGSARVEADVRLTVRR
jgi:hypothetical protein